jgi:hypothetical protein
MPELRASSLIMREIVPSLILFGDFRVYRVGVETAGGRGYAACRRKERPSEQEVSCCPYRAQEMVLQRLHVAATCCEISICGDRIFHPPTDN